MMQAVMKVGCIPAGMELFPAADEQQLDFIKKVIDDCDYYLIIIGGRYGSVTADGVSYTEKEYDYAVSKGIKVLAFLHRDPSEISFAKSDVDPTAREKLASFRSKVSTGRLIDHWNTAADLPASVALALISAIRTYPATGWVRGDVATAPELLAQTNQLRNENDELKKTVQNLQKQIVTAPRLDIAGGDEKFTVFGKYYDGFYRTWSLQLTWNQIFGLVGPKLYSPIAVQNLETTLGPAFGEAFGINGSGHTISKRDFETITIQLSALGLIKVYQAEAVKGGIQAFCTLTDTGTKRLTEIRAIKKKAEG